jgi:hypothetical protein
LTSRPRRAATTGQEHNWTVQTDALPGTIPYLGVINWSEMTPGSAPNPRLGTTLVNINP